MLKTIILNLLKSKISAGKTGGASQEKIVCKFVLIRRDDELYLVFGLVSEYPYHANLVELFCNRFDIPSSWAKKPDMMEVFDENCTVNGGGWLEIDRASSRIRFYSRSTAYGRFSRPELNQVLTDQRLFSDYQVTVSR